MYSQSAHNAAHHKAVTLRTAEIRQTHTHRDTPSTLVSQTILNSFFSAIIFLDFHFLCSWWPLPFGQPRSRNAEDKKSTFGGGGLAGASRHRTSTRHIHAHTVHTKAVLEHYSTRAGPVALRGALYRALCCIDSMTAHAHKHMSYS